MTKVRISKSTTIETEIDVTFPLYKESGDITEHGGWDYFYRYDQDGTVWCLTRRLSYADDNIEWAIDHSRWLYQNGVSGLSLDKGTNNSREFNAAWREAMEFLSSAKPADTPETA